MFKFFAVVALFVAVEAQYSHGEGDEVHHQDHYVEPHYSFAYEVKDGHTGDTKSHKEERKGDRTQGAYSLIEPDGSKRVVEYIVEGKSGFNAKVLREHLQHSPSYQSGGYGHQTSSSSGYVASSSYKTLASQGIPSGSSSDGGLKMALEENSKQTYSSHEAPEPKKELGMASKSGVNGDLNERYHSSRGFGSGEASSSVQFATNGAKIYTSIKHIIPQKHNY